VGRAQKPKLTRGEQYAAVLLIGAMAFVWGGAIWVLVLELLRRFVEP
jgi:hypothetical protein